MTLSVHPDKDELIMFGGEHFDGKKVKFKISPTISLFYMKVMTILTVFYFNIIMLIRVGNFDGFQGQFSCSLKQITKPYHKILKTAMWPKLCSMLLALLTLEDVIGVQIL